MKTASALASFLVFSLLVTTNQAQTTPALRGLQTNGNTEDSTELIQHHHHHVKKVKKIAIPVPVGVPQFIPIPISASSTVIADSNTVINSPINIANNPVGPNVGAGSPAVTPAPTTRTGRPAATPAPTTTQRSRATPAPTSFATISDSGAQQPIGAPIITAPSDTDLPSSRNFGSTNLASPTGPLGVNGFPAVDNLSGGNQMAGVGRNVMDGNRFDGRNFGNNDQVGVGGAFGGFNSRRRY